jgi:hypothetical protein
MGKLLLETTGWVGCPRISPKGDRVAFLEHEGGWSGGGWVTVVDLQGKRTRLTDEWMELQGLAWSPLNFPVRSEKWDVQNCDQGCHPSAASRRRTRFQATKATSACDLAQPFVSNHE